MKTFVVVCDKPNSFTENVSKNSYPNSASGSVLPASLSRTYLKLDSKYLCNSQDG